MKAKYIKPAWTSFQLDSYNYKQNGTRGRSLAPASKLGERIGHRPGPSVIVRVSCQQLEIVQAIIILLSPPVGLIPSDNHGINLAYDLNVDQSIALLLHHIEDAWIKKT
jgi:hypothetical protein